MPGGGPLTSKTALQSMTVQPTLEAAVVFVALASMDAAYVSSTMAKLRFVFSKLQPHFAINTGALHSAGSTYSARPQNASLSIYYTC